MSRRKPHPVPGPVPAPTPAATPAQTALDPVPVPGMTPPAEMTAPGGRSVGYVWAFRAFAVLFLLTLLAGLVNYLGQKFFK